VTQYVYRVTSSVNPKMPRGAVYLSKINEGARFTAEWYHDGNFKVQFRVRRIGTINWTTKLGKRREFNRVLREAAR
jgi:hypothetical protein